MSLSCGLVGCGRMGSRHAAAIAQSSIPLIAVADPDEAARSSLIQEFQISGSAAAFQSLDALLAKCSPTLMNIATTADSHANQALKAIKSGIRLILLEKPVATSLLQCDQLDHACKGTGARIAVNHQMRFMPQYTIPKNLLVSDAYGGIQSMHVAAGNFGMAMNATHYFEAFRFLVDEAPVSVSAWFDAGSLENPRGPQFQDVSGCVRVTTASGRRLYIDASSDQGHGVQVTYLARNGRITIDELTGTMTTVVRSPEYGDAPTSRYGMPVEIMQHQIPAIDLVDSTKAVLQALIADENYPTLADATLAVKTLVAAYHSHRRGGVSVQLTSVSDDDPEVFPWA